MKKWKDLSSLGSRKYRNGPAFLDPSSISSPHLFFFCGYSCIFLCIISLICVHPVVWGQTSKSKNRNSKKRTTEWAEEDLRRRGAALRCSHILQTDRKPTEEWWLSEAALQCSICNHSLSYSPGVGGSGRKTHYHSQCIDKIPPQLCQLSCYWSTGPSVRGRLPSYISALPRHGWWKNTGGPSQPRPSSLKTQSSSRPSGQGHQPVHPDAPPASIRLRDGRERPPNQPALVLICLHWTCRRDPQHAKIRQKFQPSILICQVRWLWVSGGNSC